MHHAENLRLRLLALLSLYDLLPYSLSRPPCGAPPLTLQEASTPKAVAACLQALMMNQDKIPGHIRANVFVRRSIFSCTFFSPSANGDVPGLGQPTSAC